MKIVLERTGGFAGIRRRYETDADEAQIMALLAADAGKFPRHADGFCYRVTIATEDGSRTIEVPEEMLIEVFGGIP